MNYLEHPETANYDLFRDCLSTFILQRYTTNEQKHGQRRLKDRKKTALPKQDSDGVDAQENSAEEMAEFLDVSHTH